MVLIRYFIFIFLIFLIVGLLSVFTYFKDIRGDISQRVENNNLSAISFVKNSLEQYILENNIDKIESTFDSVLSNDNFNGINFEFKRYIFNNDALVHNVYNIKDKGWIFSDVVVDVRLGQINRLSEDQYEFIPTAFFDEQRFLKVKFNAMKNSIVENAVAKLHFNSVERDIKIEKEQSFSYWYENFFYITFENIKEEIEINDVVIATIEFKIDDYYANLEVYNHLVKLFYYALFLFFILVVILSIFGKLILANNIIKPIEIINKYLDDVKENKFRKIDFKDKGIGEVVQLSTKISVISRKMASMMNELNVSRNMVEKRVSTDELTGLSNQKVFELDMKSAFITNTEGYVLVLKIEGLGEISKKYGTNVTNNLIEDFANCVQNTIQGISKTKLNAYRFYGSEFAVLAKRMNEKEVEQVIKAIIKELLKLVDSYTLNSSLTHIGASPIDLFGTTDSILKDANNAYKKAKEIGDNSYFIISKEEVNKKSDLLEQEVERIVKYKQFDLQYAQDTYLVDEPEKLIMQEAVPILRAKSGEMISIGAFVSIAEKNSLATHFDKLVIKQVEHYIKLHDIQHQICINLSTDSIQDEEFLTWLDGLLIYDEEVSEKIVFSITSYSASRNTRAFKEFTDNIHKYKAKVILKRYNYNEFKLEALQSFKLDFLRVHKEYTSGISEEKNKKHIVKNIMVFGDMNDVNILADSVKADKDFNELEKIGIYATSR